MRSSTFLWRVYSYCYDSLLVFIPYKNLINNVQDKLDLKKGETVLDIGCGTGNLEASAAKRVEDVNFICLDISDEMINRAKKKIANGVFKKVDFNKDQLPEKNQTIDKVVSINVVYTVKDIDSLFKEINRVLKAEGKFVMTTSIRNGLLPVIFEHFLYLRFGSFIKTIIYLPKLIFVILINVIIDKKYKTSFYDLSFIKENLIKNGFDIKEEDYVYGNLNCLLVTEKIKNV